MNLDVREFIKGLESLSSGENEVMFGPYVADDAIEINRDIKRKFAREYESDIFPLPSNEKGPKYYKIKYTKPKGETEDA